MGMTMTQKILARAAGVESCRAGELLMCKLDLVLGNDITGPVAINEFEKMGATMPCSGKSACSMPTRPTS